MLPHERQNVVSITINDDEFEVAGDATVTIKRLESGAFAIHFMKPLPYFGTSVSHCIVLPPGTVNLLKGWIETMLADGED